MTSPAVALNLLFGSVLASISLTVPAALAVGFVTKARRSSSGSTP